MTTTVAAVVEDTEVEEASEVAADLVAAMTIITVVVAEEEVEDMEEAVDSEVDLTTITEVAEEAAMVEAVSQFIMKI